LPPEEAKAILSPSRGYSKTGPSGPGFLLNSDLLIRQKRKLGQGYSVVHIYSSGLKKLHVPLPSLEEQIRIATVLSTCDREIELLKKKQGKLKEQKKGLMQKLLAGEVRVKM
jgi:type I restriction enzyme S subunit